MREGGVWHLLGHSWETEKLGRWSELKEILDYVSGRQGVRYLTNGELCRLSHSVNIPPWRKLRDSVACMPESMTHTLSTEEKRKQLLEAYFQTRPESACETPPRVAKRTAASPMPLSSAQKQLWLHAQLAPDTPLYNEPLTVRRSGALDKYALERSLTEIVRRHEAWRTVFPVVQGQPMQVVQAPFEMSLPVVDLRSLPQAERAEAAHRVAGDDARVPFDLARGPLFRATLVHLDDEEHLLFVTLHHLIFDGFSGYRVFLPELATLYEAFSHGEASPLPELDFQFADYSLLQQEWELGHEFEDRIRYWKRQLAEARPRWNFLLLARGLLCKASPEPCTP